MRKSEVLAARVHLVDQLTELDAELRIAFGRSPSNRNTAIARKLLDARSSICDDLIQVGYHPWCVPIDPEETKWVNEKTL